MKRQVDTRGVLAWRTSRTRAPVKPVPTNKEAAQQIAEQFMLRKDEFVDKYNSEGNLHAGIAAIDPTFAGNYKYHLVLKALTKLKEAAGIPTQSRAKLHRESTPYNRESTPYTRAP